MRKLLSLSCTVVLSFYLVLVGIDYNDYTGMYCNEPEKESRYDWPTYDWEEDPVYPLSEWKVDDGECDEGVCILWRPVRYLDLVTCVQLKAVSACKI